jgi:hypothetical protein
MRKITVYSKNTRTMIKFFQKYQKHISMAGAISLLIICYFQQKELARLRGEKNVDIEITIEKSDSLKKVILQRD